MAAEGRQMVCVITIHDGYAPMLPTPVYAREWVCGGLDRWQAKVGAWVVGQRGTHPHCHWARAREGHGCNAR